MDSRAWSRTIATAAVLAAVCAACLWMAAPSLAVTVTVTGSSPDQVMHIDDPANESNLIVLFQSGTTLTIDEFDSGTVSAPGVCSPTNLPEQVTCDIAGVDSFAIDLGGGNDDLQIQGDVSLPMVEAGGPGNDTLVGGHGADQIDGGPGDDTIWLDGSPSDPGDDLHGGDGTDTLTLDGTDPKTVTLDDQPGDGPRGRDDNAHSDFENVIGSDGPDTITGTPGPNLILGRDGRDHLYGGGGDDTLYGGFSYGGTESCDADVLNGGPGDDTLGPLNGGDVALGGPGNDTFLASDHTFCSNGDIHGNDPSHGNTMSGGPGIDVADYGPASERPVAVSLDGVANDGAAGRTDNVESDIEDVRGTPYDDVLVGSRGPNVLDGGAGDDILDGGRGADVLLGGDGFDVADYSSRTAPVTVDIGGPPRDDGEAGEHDTVGTDIEGIWGGAGSDHLTGGPGDDALDGGPGADVLAGGPGVDVVDYSTRTAPVRFAADGIAGDSGEAGEGDTVMPDVEGAVGGSGPDTLTGGNGDDFLLGGPGNDQLNGGPGSDDLEGESGNDAIMSLDGAPDFDSCGSGSDSVVADKMDDIGSDCESISFTAPKPPVALPPPVPPVVVRDRRAPALRAHVGRAHIRSALAHGLKVSVGCSETCTVSATARVGYSLARRLGLSARHRALIVGHGKTATAGKGSAALVIRFSRVARRRLAGARHVSVTISLTARDASGNARTRSLRTILR